MAFAEIELARVKKIVGGFCEKRVPTEIRDELRLEYSIDRHDVELYEVRPHWEDPAEEMQTPVAKFRFVRSSGELRLFWMRQGSKWHPRPFPLHDGMSPGTSRGEDWFADYANISSPERTTGTKRV